MAEDYVNETFNLFLAALELSEEEIEGLDSLNEILEIVEAKQEDED
jgi:Asp-tRNA(Asn)/Glu-tRNA(Gln) amidotransferase C subunit